LSWGRVSIQDDTSSGSTRRAHFILILLFSHRSASLRSRSSRFGKQSFTLSSAGVMRSTEAAITLHGETRAALINKKQNKILHIDILTPFIKPVSYCALVVKMGSHLHMSYFV
jgi:hypothetical protein